MAVSGTLPAPTGRGQDRVGGRVILARAAARMTAALARRARGGSGLVIGGRVLQAVAPEAPYALSRGRRTVLVTGTNGKTTTTTLAAEALRDGRRVGTNLDGANTATGLAGTLAASDAETMVLEVDEGWLPWAVAATTPVAVVLGNLSRDQLSRLHEVSSVAAAWRSCLAGVPIAVANADDPAVVWAALAARGQVWVAAGERWTADSQVCPACGGRCRRDGVEWSCDSCTLRRPRPDWEVDGRAMVRGRQRVPLDLDLPGDFNLGNAALAIAATEVVGAVRPEDGAGRLKAVTSVAGRYRRIHTATHDVRLMLAKNPAGWLELMTMMGPDSHPVVLLFNAEGVDGRDPSWLYDVSFAPLRGRQVVVQGRRATDLLVRLDLDDVVAHRVPGSVGKALATLPPGPVDVVGNYTAFRSALAELSREGASDG